MNWLWLLCGWVAMLLGLRYGLTVVILSRSRFGRMSGSVVTADRVPAYIRTLFDVAALELNDLGFRDCGYIEYVPFHRIHPPVRWQQLLVDKSGAHFATIELRYPVTGKDPFSITFYTWFTDGHLLMTVDRLAYAILDRIPNTTVADNRIHNLPRQWEYHCHQFSGMSDRIVRRFDLIGFTDRYFEHIDRYVDLLIDVKTFIPVGDGIYKRPLIKTFGYAYRLIYQRPKPQPRSKSHTIDSRRLCAND